jgi:hypothetical protein
MAAQDQHGDVQARWRLSEKPSTPNAAIAVRRPGRARRSACQRPERKARAQGLTHAWRELLEDCLPTRPFGRTRSGPRARHEATGPGVGLPEAARVSWLDGRVTNAVIHAPSELRVLVELHGTQLHLAVQDASPHLLRLVTAPDLLEEGGRGLLLVESLATSWQVQHPAGAARSSPACSTSPTDPARHPPHARTARRHGAIDRGSASPASVNHASASHRVGCAPGCA